MRHCQSCSNLVEWLMRAGERRFVTLVHGVGLVVPGLLALSCTASVSGRASGGGAYLTVTSGSVCIVLFVVGNHCVLVAHVCSVG
ncbi:hypothetical protein BJV77DRAFT_1010104 [Russula vinacea]|nr:hypothetical protein BJV77DRAFT_1010104 [Russula vinacea]